MILNAPCAQTGFALPIIYPISSPVLTPSALTVSKKYQLQNNPPSFVHKIFKVAHLNSYTLTQQQRKLCRD